MSGLYFVFIATIRSPDFSFRYILILLSVILFSTFLFSLSHVTFFHIVFVFWIFRHLVWGFILFVSINPPYQLIISFYPYLSLSFYESFHIDIVFLVSIYISFYVHICPSTKFIIIIRTLILLLLSPFDQNVSILYWLYLNSDHFNFSKYNTHCKERFKILEAIITQTKSSYIK